MSLEVISKNIGYVVAIITGLTFLYGWIAKPIKEIQTENKEQSKKLDQLDSDTADLLCSQLCREHDFFMNKGYCPTSDKVRIQAIYARYKKRGRNHLADAFMDDLMALPISKGGN